MIDLSINKKSEIRNQKSGFGFQVSESEEVSTGVIIGAVIVITIWMVWAFVIGGLL